jgi:hypothetical protein
VKRTLADRIRSSLPFLRDRVNPVTGIAYRYDAEAMRRAEAALARLRERGIKPSPDVKARDYAPDQAAVRDVLARSQESGRARVAAHADRVLGPGTAERARQALAAERHNPWEQPQRGRAR